MITSWLLPQFSSPLGQLTFIIATLGLLMVVVQLVLSVSATVKADIAMNLDDVPYRRLMQSVATRHQHFAYMVCFQSVMLLLLGVAIYPLWFIFWLFLVRRYAPRLFHIGQ